MNYWNAVLQGIIQGLTEFLPVSSSGHLSLVQHFTGTSGETGVLFSILLHFGTLIAVFIAFRRTIWAMIIEFFRALGDLFRGKFSLRDMNSARRMIVLLLISLLPLLLVVPFQDFFERVSSDNDIIVEGVCFLVTALLLFCADRAVGGRKNAGDMRYRDALIIGAAQAVAPMPGISRSGATISTGLLSGLSREFAVSFSFIMGIPAVLGVNLIKIPDALKLGTETGWGPMIVGVLAAAVFGLLAIIAVRWLVKTDKFRYFSYYTGALGVVCIIIGIVELIRG